MLLLYANENAGAAIAPAEMAGFLSRMRDFTAELANAGAFVSTNALHPSTSASTVRVLNGSANIAAGPNDNRDEQLGGYFVIDVANDQEACDWAARCPAATWGSIEVRRIMDFKPHD